MPSQPQFVTSRLILRPLELGDFEDSAIREVGWSEISHCIAPQNYRSQQVARRQGRTPRSRSGDRRARSGARVLLRAEAYFPPMTPNSAGERA